MGTMNVQFLQWVSMDFNPHGQKCVPEAKSFQLKIVGDVESSSAVAAKRLYMSLLLFARSCKHLKVQIMCEADS